MSVLNLSMKVYVSKNNSILTSSLKRKHCVSHDLQNLVRGKYMNCSVDVILEKYIV